MRKCYVLVAIIAMMLVVGLSFIGCNKEKTQSDYYPLGVGSYWEYDVLAYLEGGLTKMSKEIVKVVGKERVGDRESYVIDRYAIEGKVPSIGQYREYLAKTDKGIECTKRAFPLLMEAKTMYPSLQTDIIHSPAEERFRTSFKDGDQWKWTGIVTLMLIPDEKSQGKQQPQNPPKEEQVKGTMEYKYLGHETVHVMGKDYDCIKLSILGKTDAAKGNVGKELESEVWYAPGIGKVREEEVFYEGNQKVNFLYELVNYNITNKEPFKKK
jgi:hypothetical protein